MGHIDTMGMLNDIFGVHEQEDVLNDNGDPMIGEYVEFDDEPDSNDVLNEEENDYLPIVDMFRNVSNLETFLIL